MKITDINTLKDKLSSKKVEEKGFLDFYQKVLDEKILPVTDECNNIIGFNVIDSNPTGIAVSKKVNGMLTVGATEEERQADEDAKALFTEEFGHDKAHWQEWFELSLQLKAADIHPDDVIIRGRNYYFILASEKKVINRRGDTVVDLSDDEDLENASHNVIVKLLISSLNFSY